MRIPGSCCGVFGLKPSRHRSPSEPEWGDINARLLVEHVFTHSVRDSAAFLDVTGTASWDCAGRRPRRFGDEVSGACEPLRIGITTRTLRGEAIHPDCVAAVQTAAATCEQLGHHVEERSPRVDATVVSQAFFTMWVQTIAWSAAVWAKTVHRQLSRDLFEPRTWAMMELGRQIGVEDHLRALRAFNVAERYMGEFFGAVDIWMTPSLGEPPLPLGTLTPDPAAPLGTLDREGKFAPFTELANVVGSPAMTVPLYWNSDGMPIGTQFVARPGDDAVLFRLASQLELACPWATRIPPTLG
jgi:amidase